MPEEAREVQAKYICLDIVGYSTRFVDTQIKILRALNVIVKSCVEKTRVPQDEGHRMYLPTGDGMCIAFLDIPSRDIHLRVAKAILSGVKVHDDNPKNAGSQFQVRVGIHAQTDHVVKDINLDNNLAGAGINFAFRVMDLADGGKILISQEVFKDLKDHVSYKNAFRHYRALVKHNQVADVYEFTGDAAAAPSRRAPKAIRRQERGKQLQESIIGPARAMGLKAVYRCRNRAVVEEVIQDIVNARHKVWLSGVGLPDIIGDARALRALSSKAETLNTEGSPDRNVRVLLLDGFRSPAIFRALMESNCQDARKIIQPGKRRKLKYADPYFSHRLYRSFEAAYTQLAKMDNLAPLVRFYGHAPSCWLIIVDHKAYYQPYTFGDASDEPQSHVIGRQMPVFKFQGRSRTPYRILEDHFNKLWLTSDIDLFHTGARIIARAKVLWDTFERRKEGSPKLGEKESKWLEHIYNVLCDEENPGRDQRAYLRRPCISSLLAFAKWEGEYAEYPVTTANILDFSLEGTLLELGVDIDSKLFTSLPAHRKSAPDDIFVTLNVRPEGGWPRTNKRPSGIPDVEAARHLVDKFLEPTRHRFVYVRKDIINGKPCAAFQARAHA